MSNIVESKKFVLADAGELDGTQHNKWWEVVLYDNGDVRTSWARVGKKAQTKLFSGAGRTFVELKVREKLKGGYTEAKTISNTTSTASIVTDNLHEIAKKEIVKSSNPILEKLIDRLVKSNVHKIVNSTQLTLNDTTGLFMTPLGIVTPDAITDARRILSKTVNFVKNGSYGKELDRLVARYLRLVPQDIGMKFNVRNILPDIGAIQKQNDILDALDASYQAVTTQSNATTNTTAPDKVFKVELSIDTGNDAARLERWFESSKKSSHGYDRIKIRNVFKVKIEDMETSFVPDNNMEIFHGTSEANCLSILKSGIRTSPPETTKIAGKMWGPGVYGAINSSKSLGYTYGKWGQTSGESGWLYICQFAMGKIHYPERKTYNENFKVPSGYDSTWATAAKTGLFHDELIVYQNNRVNITHLLECK